MCVQGSHEHLEIDPIFRSFNVQLEMGLGCCAGDIVENVFKILQQYSNRNNLPHHVTSVANYYMKFNKSHRRPKHHFHIY